MSIKRMIAEGRLKELENGVERGFTHNNEDIAQLCATIRKLWKERTSREKRIRNCLISLRDYAVRAQEFEAGAKVLEWAKHLGIDLEREINKRCADAER